MTTWPTPADAAVLHGPAGEFVSLTEPHTESDPMALLAQFMVSFGTAVGRSAHYAVEASKHFGNEFIVLVGPSSKGRKGSSWDHVERLMGKVDPHFIESCVSSGMSSGEGLIAAVADDEDRQPDKRRLVVEPEFAQVMRVLSREGNTLSPVVRNAWDGKTLQTMVRNAPLRASDTHIGIVAHITKEELLRHIDGTELANGFFNRFMLIAVKRSKRLPFGGALRDEDLDDIRQQILAALLFAGQQTGPLTFDADAREKWIAVYDELSDGHPGLWGAAAARAEAHTVRLALLYALLDCAPAIRLEHLDAALASGSAHWVFGDSLGDPTADEIWEMAKTNPQGVTRTQVSDLFSRNKRAREIDRALTALVEAGRLERGETRTGGAGRPAVVWRPHLRRASRLTPARAREGRR